jgi:hypothetical protein
MRGKCEICGFEGPLVNYAPSNLADEDANNRGIPLEKYIRVCLSCAYDLNEEGASE